MKSDALSRNWNKSFHINAPHVINCMQEQKISCNIPPLDSTIVSPTSTLDITTGATFRECLNDSQCACCSQRMQKNKVVVISHHCIQLFLRLCRHDIHTCAKHRAKHSHNIPVLDSTTPKAGYDASLLSGQRNSF